LAKPGEGSRRVEYRDLLATDPEVAALHSLSLATIERVTFGETLEAETL
jgi:hypothetical protein